MTRPAVLLALVLAMVAAVDTAAARRAAPSVHVTVFADTGWGVDSIVWTGSNFLYVVNTHNTVYEAPPAGMPLTLFASMPPLVEETRCILSPGSNGFPSGVIFCHSEDNKIYEISPDGTSMHVFAQLPAPYPPAADGALTFDSAGRFGYQLVAATGRSGVKTPSGGVVYTINASGQVHEVGGYKGPGGADEVAIAPPSFGPLAGEALLSVDAGASGGAIVAMTPSGATRTIARFPSDGPNPIVTIPTTWGSTSTTSATPAPGIYMTDDLTKDVYFVSAAQLARYAGDVFVSTEDTANFFVLVKDHAGVRVLRLPDDLVPSGHGIEGAAAVG